MIKKTNITPTIESGLLVAISVILGLVSVYIPVLGIIVDFFWAIPFAILAVRLDISRSFYSLILAVIILSLFVGPLLAIRLALSFGLGGLALGYALSKNFDAVKIFMLTLIVSFAAQVLSVILLLLIMDINVMDEQIAMIRESFEQSFAIYKSMGIDESQILEAQEQVEPAIKLVGMLMPTILLIMALINTVACYLSAKWIFPKIGLSVPILPPFSEWRFPVAFLYLMVIAILGLYWGGTRDLPILYTVSINANLLSLFIGFLQGMSILSFVANRYKISKLIRRLIFIFVIFNFMLFQIVAFTGLFDMFFDYRRRFSERK